MPSKKISEKKEAEKKDPNNKQLYFIFGAMILAFVIMGLAVYIAHSANKFDYQGLSFTKEKFGKIDVYHYYYNFKGSNDQIYRYNLYLRGDPRNTNTTVEGMIDLGNRKDTVYLSYDIAGLLNCPMTNIAVPGLAAFLTDNMISIKGAALDVNEAKARNITHATCDVNPGNHVIEISSGDENLISSNGNCHKITVANCQILDALEKFEVQAIIDAKALNPTTS